MKAGGIAFNAREASTLRMAGDRLVVGLKTGGVAVLDGSIGRPILAAAGGSSEAQCVLAMPHGYAWSTKDSSTLYLCDKDGKSTSIDLSEPLKGPIRRIGRWFRYIGVQSDSELRFVDPNTKMAEMPEDVLGPDLAAEARQGPTAFYASGDKGLFVTMRRYGERQKAQAAGGIKQIGILSAWSVRPDERPKYLGGYTCSVLDFHDAPGAPVQIKVGEKVISNPHGDADTSNVLIGPEGVVAIDQDNLLTIPFYQNSWEPRRVEPAIKPKYARTCSYAGPSMWWSSGSKLYCASLEDGGTEVFAALHPSPVVSIAAEPDGAWVLRKDGLVHISHAAHDLGTSGRYVWYELGAQTTRPVSVPHARLWAVAKAAQKGQVRHIATSDPDRFVRSLFKASRLKATGDLMAPRPLADLQFGDVVSRRDYSAIYMGDGKVLTARNGQVLEQPLSVDGSTQISRPIHAPLAFASPDDPAPGGHGVDISRANLFPIGIGAPNPGLGYALYARITPGTLYDGPHLPIHYQLLDEIRSWQGVPYRWGGSTHDGVDCSGFVSNVFSAIGIPLPHQSQIIGYLQRGQVVYDELHFGDVLVFSNPGHVAIYIGNGRTAETVGNQVSTNTAYGRRCAIVRRFIPDS